jgi:H+/Cl- antiporter ClcA
MGIGAMSAVMLRLPLTSVLLATLLLASDGLAVMPLVIVAVVVAYMVSARLAPSPVRGSAPGRQGGAHEPQDRDEEADQAQDPMTLAEGNNGHREQQDEIQDAEANDQS